MLATVDVEVRIPSANDPDEMVPVAGALVAFDKPGGGRIEATTGADGRVTFGGIDWSLSPPGAVTSYFEGYALHSYVGLNEETTAWFMDRFDVDALTSYLMDREDDPLVTITGTAENMDDTANWLILSANRNNSIHSEPGADFSLDVAPDEAFKLIGLEYTGVAAPTVSTRGYETNFVKWSFLDHAAVSAPTSGVALDMDHGMTPTTVSGSYAVPQHGITTFFDLCRPLLRTSCAGSNGTSIWGLAARADVSANGQQINYDLEYVDAGDGTDQFSWLGATQGDSSSMVMVTGKPTAGEQAIVMPEPPSIRTGVIPMGGAFTWELNEVDRADPDLSVNGFLRNRSTQALVWVVLAPHGSTEMPLPDLPSGIEPDDALDFGVLEGNITLCGASDPGPFEKWCSRWAQGITVQLIR